MISIKDVQEAPIGAIWYHNNGHYKGTFTCFWIKISDDKVICSAIYEQNKEQATYNIYDLFNYIDLFIPIKIALNRFDLEDKKELEKGIKHIENIYNISILFPYNKRSICNICQRNT